jgi:TonB family protein
MAPEIITRIRSRLSQGSPAFIMKACITASFLFHLIILLSFQKAFPFWNTSELRTYNVEIIRPPTEGLDKADAQGSTVKGLDKENEAASKDSQDTISLDTKDERYIGYAGLIKKAIMRSWNYPDQAKLELVEGKVQAVFSLLRDGTMTQIKIEHGSGHEILDKEVQRAIKASQPFPSFPASIKVARLNIKAQFDYRLSSGEKGK